MWVLKDRSSFLNLDYLLAQHLRLGVDTYYCYGLIPVAVQHFLFVVFGRSYRPLIGFTLVTLCALAFFWARLLDHLPRERIWLVVLVGIAPILLWVNPNLPYSIVQLSILFSLLCVLEDRLDLALAFAVAGWFSVPSLPLALTGLLIAAIVIRTRSLPSMIRQLTPGVLTFLALIAVSAPMFGWKSVAVTSTPLLGIKFYRVVHFDALTTARDFIYPPGHRFLYYVGYYPGTAVTWWFVSTITLLVFGASAARTIWRQRTLDPRNLFLCLCAVLQAIFAFAARGSVEQHVIYDPLLAAGILIGIAGLPQQKTRRNLLVAFAAVAVLSEAAQARATVLAWMDTRAFPSTDNLYATPTMAAEWSQIVDTSRQHNLLMLSYATGAHNYFPTVHTADTWMMRRGQLFPADRQRVLTQLKNADVVVEDLTSVTSAMDSDADIQSQLRSMCLTRETANFLIWFRPGLLPASTQCLPNLRMRAGTMQMKR